LSTTLKKIKPVDETVQTTKMGEFKHNII